MTLADFKDLHANFLRWILITIESFCAEFTKGNWRPLAGANYL